MRHLSMTWWNGALYTVFSQVMIKNRKAYLYTPQEKFKKKKELPAGYDDDYRCLHTRCRFFLPSTGRFYTHVESYSGWNMSEKTPELSESPE